MLITLAAYLHMSADLDERAVDSLDALDHAVSADLDAISASAVDPVAYHEISALASLDDEIDHCERF